MKKNSILVCIALILGLSLPLSTYAVDNGTTTTQDLTLKVDGSALLAITSNTGAVSPTVSISLTGASEAGAEVKTTVNDNTSRLKISSLVEDGKTRNISAQITAASSPMSSSGTQLFVTLTPQDTFNPALANGGTTAGEVELTDAITHDLVTGITTCWSGTAADNGYIINYRYAKKTGATSLKSVSLTITYTISGQV
ncbi:MAG: hypothetical protein Q8914_01895 [Bacteroidota bacterium]|nr:hypothetical protein [Bacteroidota bacterium]